MNSPIPMSLLQPTAPPEILKLLIVDDEAMLRDLYARLLEDPTNRHCETCANGREAMTRLAAGDIDVVVLDLGLPDVNGSEIMDWMVREGLSTAIVISSANTDIDSAIHALHRGAFAFVRKQGNPEMLISAVDRAMAQQRHSREHARLQAKLRDSERLHRFFVDQSPDLIYSVDREGRFTYLNPAAEKLLGEAPEALIGRPIRDVVHDEDVHLIDLALAKEAGTASATVELRLKTASDGVCHVDHRLILDDFLHSTPTEGLSGVARDITRRKHNEALIVHQNLHDLLTGLPNRLLFKDRVDQATRQATRRQERLAVLFINLDRFRLINDLHGSQEGDRLLINVGQRLSAALRGGDTIARLGGDEFMVLLPDVRGTDDVGIAGEKMLNELGRPYPIGDSDFHPSASVGMAIFPEDGDNAEELILHASQAMQHAKAHGHSGLERFHSPMHRVQTDRTILELDLRRTLKRGGDEFELHFQPQIDHGERCVLGAEALIRWKHPTRGYIRPDVFVSIAEEHGLIELLSDWVLNEACLRLAELHAAGFTTLKIGVNLSALEFQQPRLIDRISVALARHNLPPSALDIEITESLVLHDSDMVVEHINQLRRNGVSVSIDDFGTRYSCMANLGHFQFNKVKIDQAFVREMCESSGARAVVHAILVIARGYGLQVIAEGVETQAQRDTLDEIGCQHMQGYYYSKPLPFPELLAYLSAPELA